LENHLCSPTISPTTITFTTSKVNVAYVTSLKQNLIQTHCSFKSAIS
jgi:hypothetical protein